MIQVPFWYILRDSPTIKIIRMYTSNRIFSKAQDEVKKKQQGS